MLVPEPVIVNPPWVRVNVHNPPEGSPLNTTLPVPNPHEGWVTVPTTGDEGMALTVSV